MAQDPPVPFGRPPTLAMLRDRVAVREVVLRYARAVDRRDLQGVASCFTPDAAYSGALSQRSIGDAVATLERALSRWDVTLHVMGNQVVDLDGDLARCETYAIAYHHRVAEGERRELAVAVIYRDELVRRAGERGASPWLIRKRFAEGLMERIRHGLAAYGTTMHFVANHLAEVDGDEARCETYCLAHHRPAAGDRRNDLLVIGLRYLDVMARHDGAWRIARRVVAFDWRRLETGVLAPSR